MKDHSLAPGIPPFTAPRPCKPEQATNRSRNGAKSQTRARRFVPGIELNALAPAGFPFPQATGGDTPPWSAPGRGLPVPWPPLAPHSVWNQNPMSSSGGGWLEGKRCWNRPLSLSSNLPVASPALRRRGVGQEGRGEQSRGSDQTATAGKVWLGPGEDSRRRAEPFPGYSDQSARLAWMIRPLKCSYLSEQRPRGSFQRCN